MLEGARSLAQLAVSREVFCLQEIGCVVAAADVNMGTCFDVTAPAGFLPLGFCGLVRVTVSIHFPRASLLLLRRVRAGGFAFFAPLCGLAEHL